ALRKFVQDGAISKCAGKALNALPRRFGSDRHTYPLNFSLAPWILHFQSHYINSCKIRTGSIERDESRDFHGQTLFIVGGGYLALFHRDFAVFWWAPELDGR